MTKPSEAQCLQAVNADVLLCTSQLGVENLLQILQAFRQQIINKPLVVLSERIKTFAMKAGFQSVYVTASTTDEAVIECIMQMET
jgi:uroporphyrinogen-III synthase